MVERRADLEKENNNIEKSIEDEFKEIVSKNQQIFARKSELSNDDLADNNEIKLNEEDEESDNDSSSTSDDSSDFREKEKELKEFVKNQLSLEAQDVINMNEDEFNEIIEQLRKRGLSKDKGVHLQQLRNIKKGRGGISI